ncbi:unnamed protein product [Linum trigynum]|uniref:Uncharacterized protein n=1 Tax=Linum trigynum TaxID=586398 RepID=A0AAV2DZ75_9ROSI
MTVGAGLVEELVVAGLEEEKKGFGKGSDIGGEAGDGGEFGGGAGGDRGLGDSGRLGGGGGDGGCGWVMAWWDR